MSVDLSKLKIGDTIKLRNGERHVVERILPKSGSFPFRIESTTWVDASRKWYAHTEAGTVSQIDTDPEDIVRIHPAGSIGSAPSKGGRPEGVDDLSDKARAGAAAAPLEAPPVEVERVYSSGAKRNTVGKTPYGYVPLDLLDGAARVMEHGHRKYGRLEPSHPLGPDENFRAGFPPQDSLHNLLRHLTAVQRAVQTEDRAGAKGHLRDADSGQGHIHHVITCALLLLQSMRKDGYEV